MIAAKELLGYARGKALIGDTGYDSNEVSPARAPSFPVADRVRMLRE